MNEMIIREDSVKTHQRQRSPRKKGCRGREPRPGKTGQDSSSRVISLPHTRSRAYTCGVFGRRHRDQLPNPTEDMNHRFNWNRKSVYSELMLATSISISMMLDASNLSLETDLLERVLATTTVFVSLLASGGVVG